MKTPKISIIIPVYNAYDTLSAAVSSVINQSFQDWEMVIIDDGSSDDSLKLALSIASEDQRIRVIGQENRGVSQARNLGAEISRGSMLAFLDADDAWRMNKLMMHYQFHLSNPDVDASFARIAFRETIDINTNNIRTFSTVPVGPVSLNNVIADNPVCTMSNLMVTRKVFFKSGGFEQGMNYAEDQEWLARIIAMGYRLEGIPETLTDYRMSESGLSSELDKMLAGWRTLAIHYSDRINLPEAEAIYCRYLARRALRTRGPAQQALRYAMHGVARDPRGFMSDPRRGSMTLVGSFAGLFLPRQIRSRIFA